MINLDEWNDKPITDLITEIVDTLNKHERYLEALKQSIEYGGKVNQLFIDAFKEKEDKRNEE